MQTTHPKLYNYCLNVLGYKKVFDYLGIAYEARETLYVHL